MLYSLEKYVIYIPVSHFIRHQIFSADAGALTDLKTI